MNKQILTQLINSISDLDQLEVMNELLICAQLVSDDTDYRLMRQQISLKIYEETLPECEKEIYNIINQGE